MVIKSEWMLKFFGCNSWAEEKFGTWGGSRAFYKLIGLVIITLSLFYVTGWLEDILISTFVPGR